MYGQNQLVPSLPGGLYNGGAGVVNLSGFDNFIENSNRRKQAMQEAVMKNIDAQQAKLTSSGARGQDMPDILKDVADWRDYAVKNREALRNMNDGGEASLIAGTKYNHILQKVAKSKQMAQIAAEDDKLNGGKNDYRDEAYMQARHLHDLPLTDPQQTPLDVQGHHADVPYNMNKILPTIGKYVSGVDSPEVPEVGPDGKPTGRLVTNTTKDLNPTGMAAIQTIANSEYLNNRGLRKMVHQLTEDPKSYQQLNDFYKSKTGQDLDIEHPEQAAGAILAMAAPGLGTKSQKYRVQGRTEKQRLAEIAARGKVSASNIRLGKDLSDRNNARARQRINDSKTPGEQDAHINEYVNTLLDNSSKFVEDSKTASGQQLPRQRMIPADATLKRAFQRGSGAKSISPDHFVVSPDKTMVTPIYLNAGQSSTGYAPINKDLSKPIPIEQFKVAVGKGIFGTKELNNEMKGKKSAIKKGDPLGLF